MEATGEEEGHEEGPGGRAGTEVSWCSDWEARVASQRATAERMWDLGGIYPPERLGRAEVKGCCSRREQEPDRDAKEPWEKGCVGTRRENKGSRGVARERGSRRGGGLGKSRGREVRPQKRGPGFNVRKDGAGKRSGTAGNDFVRSRTIRDCKIFGGWQELLVATGVKGRADTGETSAWNDAPPGLSTSVTSVVSTTAGAMESRADSSSDP